MRIAVVYNISNKGVINVFGRQNKERYSEGEIDAVVRALKSRKHTVETFEGDKSLIENLEAFMPQTLKGETPGLVFNLAYGIQGESRYTHIPSLLEMLGIPYVGSGPLAHSVALDKAITKMVLRQAGLPTASFQVFTTPDDALDPSLNFPLIVKPKDEAVSFGIQLVRDEQTLREAVAQIAGDFRQPALVEQFLGGRETNVGLLGNCNGNDNGDGNGPEVLPIVEVDFAGAEDQIQTFETKKAQTFAHVCPAELPEDVAQQIRDVARRAFIAIGCSDCARVDLRMDRDGRPFILEINSMPAIHRNGSFTHAAHVAGYDYDAMINRMVEVAAQRYFGAPPATQRRRKPASRETAAQVKVADLLRSSANKMEEMLQTLVNHKSFARNKAATDEVGLVLQRGLEPLGFSCQMFPQAEIGDIRLLQNDPGSRTADLMLLCHTDVILLSDDRHRRFRKEGSRYFGTGIAESKGGLVVIEHALRALRHLRLLRHLRVKVLLTTDAALGNKYSESIVHQQATLSRRVLCFKPGACQGQVVTKRNGMAALSAVVEGEGMRFTADEYVEGANAIDELARKIRAWHALSDPGRGILVYVHSLKAEEHAGSLPDHAHASIFCSFPTVEDGERVVGEIRKIAKRSFVSGAHCTLTNETMRPPFSETEAVEELYAEVARVADSIGRPLGTIPRYIAGDINCVPGGVAALDGMGPVGNDTRTSTEHIEARTLVERSVLLTLFMRSLALKTGAHD